MIGIIKKFNKERGFGFIRPSDEKNQQKDIFFHFSDIVGEDKTIEVGEKVDFKTVSSLKGDKAINIVRLFGL